MNIKRTALSAATALALIVGGAATSFASGATVFESPGSNGCGALRSVTLIADETALWDYRTCEHDTEGGTTNLNGVYIAPTMKQRKGCGTLLNLTVKPNGKGLFRFENCDIAAR